jgi:hypothetical protein
MSHDLKGGFSELDEDWNPPPLALPWATEIARESHPITAAERRLEEARRWRAEVERALVEELDPE